MKKHFEDLLAWCKSKGIKVTFASDAHDLHDYAAMNPAAAKKLGYKRIKRDEYKIDSTLPEKIQFENLIHELVEDEIIEDGSEYWPAHVFSLKAQKWPIKKVKRFVSRRKGKAPEGHKLWRCDTCGVSFKAPKGETPATHLAVLLYLSVFTINFL